MPTTDKSHGQNANLGWHFVWLAFCPVGILSAHLVVFVLIYVYQVICEPRRLLTFLIISFFPELAPTLVGPAQLARIIRLSVELS